MKYSLGIDVGGTNLRMGLVSSHGEVVYHHKQSTLSTDAKAFLAQMEEQISFVKSQSPEVFHQVGIGWPGPVDRQTKKIQSTPNITGFSDFDLVGYLQKKFPNFEFQIENDAKCAGLAEQKFGAGKNLSDFVLLTFGTGIGGVIFSNGKLVYGQSGGAGEIGHNTLYPNGLACGCGNHGCFERYCSAKAIENRAEKILGRTITAKDFISAVMDKQSWAEEIFETFCEDLSFGIASIVNIFNPEAVIFGGGLFTTGGEIILKQVQQKISNRCFKEFQKNLQLKSSVLHGQAGLVGAASLYF